MRIIKVVLALVAIFSNTLVSCGKTKDDFDLYRSYQNSAKGLEVYCWEEDKIWYSGILPGTNRLKSIDEVK